MDSVTVCAANSQSVSHFVIKSNGDAHAHPDIASEIARSECVFMSSYKL
jgi:hypothetical protein